MKRTKSGRDLFETWALIKACLEAEAPLPEDIHEYLLEVADGLDKLNERVRKLEIAPERAADAVPAHLGLTAGAYRKWLRACREFIVTNVLAHQVDQAGRKSEDVARDLAEQLGAAPRTIYRYNKPHKLKKQP